MFKRKLIFGIVSGWGTQVISLAIGIFTMPLFFRYLPKDELGVWMFILGTGVFVDLADFGFSPVLIRSLSFELGKGDKESKKNFEGSSYFYSLSQYISSFSAPILCFGMVVLGGIFIWSLKLPLHLQRPALYAWLIFSLAQGLSCRYRYLETTLTSHGEVGWQNWVQMVLQLFSLGAYFVVLNCFDGGVAGLSSVILARNAIYALWLGCLVSRRIDSKYRVKEKVSWNDVKPHIKPALDMFLISLGAFLVLNTDQYFIVQFLGSPALPDYSAAYRLVQVVFTFASTASAMCIPFIARKSAAGDSSGVHELLLINTTVGMLIQMGAVAVIAVFGDYIIQIWLGENHFIGWNVLWVFCIMLSLENHHVIFARFGLSATIDPTWGKMSILSGLINLILTFIAIQHLGLLGVALSTLIAQLMTNNWYAVAKTLRIIKMEFHKYLLRSGLFWFGCGAITLIFLHYVRESISSTFVSLAVGSCISVVSCGSAVLIFFKNRIWMKK